MKDPRRIPLALAVNPSEEQRRLNREFYGRRLTHRESCAQAHAETVDKFSPLTASNAAKAMAWWAARTAELHAVSKEERS